MGLRPCGLRVEPLSPAARTAVDDTKTVIAGLDPAIDRASKKSFFLDGGSSPRMTVMESVRAADSVLARRPLCRGRAGEGVVVASRGASANCHPHPQPPTPPHKGQGNRIWI